ncbi:MAG: hypothetical protein ABI721_02600 [Candidatus Dojkabacteria bacterium]
MNIAQSNVPEVKNKYPNNLFNGGVNGRERLQSRVNAYKKISLKSFLTSLGSIKAIIIFILILQLIIILSIYNPITIIQNFQNQQFINQVLQKAKGTYTETPVVASVTDVGKLKQDNVINAEIYKDTKNGDSVLVFTNSLIIYRASEGSIIYEGDNPTVTSQKNQQTLLNNIQALAKTAGLIGGDSKEIPQLSVVTDPEQLKKQNSENGSFYSDIMKNDIVVFFTQEGKVAIYRSDKQKFITIGNYSTTIQTVQN